LLVTRPRVTLEFIRVADMTPNHAYQRERKAGKVQTLVQDWVDHRVGALIVNRRSSGEILIDDGGHRWDAARQRFGDDYELPCVVNENLDGHQESDVFLGVNRDRTNVGKWEEYRVGLEGGHRPYVDIEGVLRSRGLGAAKTARTHRIGAIQSLLRIDAAYGLVVLGQTLDVLAEAFTRDATTWDADMLQGVARLFGLNEHVDHERLCRTLRRFTVPQWRIRALSGQRSGPLRRATTIAQAIADDYNKRLGPERQLVVYPMGPGDPR